MGGYTPPLDSAASLTVWIGFVSLSTNMTGNTVSGNFGLPGVTLAAGAIVQILGAGPSGAPLWTTVASGAGISTFTTVASASQSVSGVQCTVYVPLIESTFGTSGGGRIPITQNIIDGSIAFEKSLSTRPTLDFTIYSSNGYILSLAVWGNSLLSAGPQVLVGVPVLLTDSSLATAPFGGEVGDIFGGSIEQAKCTNYPATGEFEIECQCVSWDAIAARRLLVLTPGFQTSPGYEAGQQTLTYNGAAASPSNPNGVNTGLSYYLPPGSPPGTRPTQYVTSWFNIFPPPINIVLITLNGTAVAYGPYGDTPPQGPGGYDFYWSPANNPAVSIDPSLTLSGTDTIVFTVNGTAASGGANIIPSLTFTNTNADAIAVALISFIAAPEGISITGNVAAGPLIQSIQFPASQSIDAALSSLCEFISGASGAYWYYIDPRKGFNFAIQGVSNPAPWNIEETDGSDGNVLMVVSNTVTREKFYNAAWLDLSTLANQVSVYCQGDGTTQSFNMPYPIAAAPSVTLYTGNAPYPTPTGVIVRVEATNDGQNYSAGDTITLEQAGSGNNANIIVQSVLPGPGPTTGAIQSYALGAPGTGYSDSYLDPNAPPVTSAGGTGSGATWAVSTGVATQESVGLVGETGFDFYWSPGSSELKQDAGNPAIIASQFLLVTFQPSASTYTQYIDTQAALIRQYAEGGSGEYDQYLNLANTLPLVQGPPAQVVGLNVAQALAELFSQLAQQVDVDTYNTGIAPGMSIGVNLQFIAQGTFVVQSVRLTDEGRLQLWKLSLISGLLIGDWKTAIKYFTAGGSAPPAVLPTTTSAPSATGTAFYTITYAATITPDYTQGTTQFCQLTGNVTVANVTSSPTGSGQPLTLILQQDATGGRTVTWGSDYSVGSPAIAPPQPSQVPYAQTVYEFRQTDTPGVWQYLYSYSDM